MSSLPALMWPGDDKFGLVITFPAELIDLSLPAIPDLLSFRQFPEQTPINRIGAAPSILFLGLPFPLPLLHSFCERADRENL